MESECWKNKCKYCMNGRLFVYDMKSASPEVFWKEWRKNDTGRLYLSVQSGCEGELVESLRDSWSDFQEHVRVKRIQAHKPLRKKEKSKCLCYPDGFCYVLFV